ncbi:hypothetical protein EG68_07755 [Paragonimus skrjabini miyazakii]|uniref:Uncharacterized protein n=1 Tax=Paragonimus skrjabini miyazakii TaxID=59628 RepID=A0A8S9YHH7_9TREM|nr:hypothetical protein EG68_07755 [Paragonimus skrjabini miyazakii]
MGNSTPARLTSFGSCERKTSVSNSCVMDRSRILTVDPRSPSEGIIRTPIQIDKCDNFHFEESDLKRGEVLTHATCGNSTSVDLNNLDSLNGLLTEDDSIHRTEIVEDGHSALSDTEVSKKVKNRPSFGTPGALSHIRLSWVDRFGKRSSARDSPSLFVRLRHKHNYEKQKTSGDGRLSQHGDSSDSHRDEPVSNPKECFST